MPSRKSPSQRDFDGRLARVVASMIPGTHGGRVLNASPASSPRSSVPAASPPAAGTGVYLDTVIKQGAAGVATNVFPAGTRVPQACTTSGFFARCNPSHMPSGSACTVVVKRSGSTVATVSIAAGASSGSVSTAVTLALGDVLTYDITSVGSTTPAWDVAVGIAGA